MDLDRELERYKKKDIYPFHMPGHKRKGPAPYDTDITEIDGFDDLHAPEGMILSLQRSAARLYGAGEAFLLVNGSTAGNLAAIYAGVSRGGRMLMARNCHKSVYHGAILRQAKVSYLYPEYYRSEKSSHLIAGKVDPEEIRKHLSSVPVSDEKKYEAVVITSPTYEGVISDIASIAKVCHEFGAALIVDAAHGAHYGFFSEDSFGENPVAQGADAVIVSLHKTLPSLTQTALLLLSKDSPIDPDKVFQALHMFQTSSPSYVLMASVSRCMRFMQEKGRTAFLRYKRDLIAFYEECKGLSEISLLPMLNDRDPSKIVILCGKDTMLTNSGEAHGNGAEQMPAERKTTEKKLRDQMPPEAKLTEKTISETNLTEKKRTKEKPGEEKRTGEKPGKQKLTGKRLSEILREDYGIELEMASFSYALAMSSVCDTKADLDRLRDALYSIDRRIASGKLDPCLSTESVKYDRKFDASEHRQEEGEASSEEYMENTEQNRKLKHSFRGISGDFRFKKRYELWEALEMPAELMDHQSAIGKTAASFISIYPPGIPIICPGEILEADDILLLKSAFNTGLTVTGIEDGRIRVLKE